MRNGEISGLADTICGEARGRVRRDYEARLRSLRAEFEDKYGDILAENGRTIARARELYNEGISKLRGASVAEYD